MATEFLGWSMDNTSGALVSTWVKVCDTTRIDYHVCNEGEVEFSIGGRHGFVLATTELGLHNLADRAQEALREVQSMVDDEDCPTA
ncbi:MAG: hypothetical protein ACRDRQ_24970 [Pseudonocardiaceae bacterium]